MEKTIRNTTSEITQNSEFEALGFVNSDIDQILEKGLSIEEAVRQMQVLNKGISKTKLDRPATFNDGIIKLSETEYQEFADYFDANKSQFVLEKFVPASGAATRMFKFLIEFLQKFDKTESINAYINRHRAAELSTFILAREKFPFYKAIRERLQDLSQGEQREKDGRLFQFIEMLLQSPDFNFSEKPKGILPFHKYSDHIATPVEEHLWEASRYASSNNQARLHFTISESHREAFQDLVTEVLPRIIQLSQVDIKVDFSTQHAKTDTLAADEHGKPFRGKSGKLLFRPGGHGALIENLNQLNADVVFIKNIDNVIQNHKDVITLYKKALGGLLMQLQQQINNYLSSLDDSSPSCDLIQEMKAFLQVQLNVTFAPDFDKFTTTHQIEFIREKLHRPLRICGMVKNEGEPGGGPFWVIGQQGNISLQIVETSQIDTRNPEQQEIVEAATHFNPVDIVCSIRDYKGNKFHLPDFVDQERGFIVSKNKDGRALKSYELPGLWNGAMAKWNTVFVEVPLVTFNPVKTVNDLLKPAHQPS